MNDTYRRPWKVWLGCAVVLPLLAACASESGAPSEADTQSTSEALDADLNQVNAVLSASKSAFAAGEGAEVTVTLTNTASHAVRFLRWQTPVDGVQEPRFEITRDGEVVPYIGRITKRAAPTGKDYVVLQPGESLTRTVDLSDAYDLSTSGNYTFNFRSEGVSNLVAAYIEGRPSARAQKQAAAVKPALGTTSFSGGCSASQQSDLRTALSGADTYATGAYNYLNTTTPSGTARYTTWFGSFTSSRWSTAKTHYSKIKSAFDTQDFTFDCSCTDSGTYAYVYPDEPYTVYLCGAFWSAPQTGTDSKGGTLVHETSHFTVTAGTQDNAYGQSACKSLAKSSPTQALNNADSHEYFAENNPKLN